MNLAHLLVARGPRASRASWPCASPIGAGRERLVRQLLTESLLVTGCGGALGVLIAMAATPLIARLVPTSLPIAEMPGLDLRLLALAALVTLATGIASACCRRSRLRAAPRLDALREPRRSAPGRGDRAPAVRPRGGGSDRVGRAARRGGAADARAVERAAGRSRVSDRRRADDAHGAAVAGVREHRAARAVLRARPRRTSARCRACRPPPTSASCRW